MYFINSIKDNERFGKAEIIYARDNEVSENEFFTQLGGKPLKIKSAIEGGEDDLSQSKVIK